jgi:hypothetical protein
MAHNNPDELNANDVNGEEKAETKPKQNNGNESSGKELNDSKLNFLSVERFFFQSQIFTTLNCLFQIQIQRRLPKMKIHFLSNTS